MYKLLKYIKVLVVFFITIFILTQFIIQPFYIKGNSMLPTFKDRDLVLVSKLHYLLSQPRRGDIILFKNGISKNDYLIKRIITFQNDTIQIVNGKIYVNDALISEEYVKHKDNRSFYKRVTPVNSFFVLGDNRLISKDSRYKEIGFINKDSVIGKVIFKF